MHILDSAVGVVYQSGDPAQRSIVELGGARTQVSVALRREGTLLGSFTIWRHEVRPFTDKQISLLQNFAAQAVIAMQNVLLYHQVQMRTEELSEALAQQTATAEVLRAISSSPGELAPVFDAMLANARRICEAEFATLYRYENEAFVPVATVGVPPAFAEYMK